MEGDDDGKTRELDDEDRVLLSVLGENIRRLRVPAGMTQEQLAWSAGLDKGYMSRIESGERAPSLFILRKLAIQLGVEPWELLRPSDHTPEAD